jgi:hypothetical protein
VPPADQPDQVDLPALTNPIAPTSRWMAAARARESERADRLFCDPLAAALAGPEGFTWLAHLEAAAWSNGPGLYPVIRTRFFDDFVLDSCRRLGVRQVVLAAAGLDARAFRLAWPSRTRLYEMDLPEVLRGKCLSAGRRCGRMPATDESGAEARPLRGVPAGPGARRGVHFHPSRVAGPAGQEN